MGGGQGCDELALIPNIQHLSAQPGAGFGQSRSGARGPGPLGPAGGAVREVLLPRPELWVARPVSALGAGAGRGLGRPGGRRRSLRPCAAEPGGAGGPGAAAATRPGLATARGMQCAFVNVVLLLLAMLLVGKCRSSHGCSPQRRALLLGDPRAPTRASGARLSGLSGVCESLPPSRSPDAARCAPLDPFCSLCRGAGSRATGESPTAPGR